MSASARFHVLVPPIIVIVVAAVAVGPVGSFYLTNDDIVMRLLAEGRFAPGADRTPFLMFINVILGGALAALYGVTDIVPWYDLLMLSTTVIGCLVLVQVWTAPGTVTAYAGALLLALFFMTPLFATPQFSLASMISASAGITLIARPLIVPLADDARRRHLVWGTVLIVWGALIRWEAAVLLLTQAALSVLVTRLPGLRARGLASSMRPVAGAAALTTVLLGLAFAINLGAYRVTPGWRDFYEFNLARARVSEYAAHQTPSAEALAALRVATGWSANDLALLREWLYSDATVFTLEKLHAARAVLDAHTPPPTESVLRPASLAMRELLFTLHWPAICVLAAFALAQRRPVRHVAILVALIAIVYVLLVAITVTLKEAPFRLYWPMLILVAGLLPSAAPPPGTPPPAATVTATAAAGARNRLARGAALLVLLGAAVVVLPSALDERWRELQARHALAEVGAGEVAALRQSGATFVVIGGAALRWEYVWRPFRRADFGVPFIGIGASAQTPPLQQALQRYGALDLVQGLCTHDRWLLIFHRTLMPLLTTFMAEHHGQRVRFEAVVEGQILVAWRCRVE